MSIKSKINEKLKIKLQERKWKKKIERISTKQQIRKLSIQNKNQIKSYWKTYTNINNYTWQNTYNYLTEEKYDIEKFIPENLF